MEGFAWRRRVVGRCCVPIVSSNERRHSGVQIFAEFIYSAFYFADPVCYLRLCERVRLCIGNFCAKGDHSPGQYPNDFGFIALLELLDHPDAKN